MGLWDTIKSLLGGRAGPSGSSEPAYWIYARCKRCGEIIRSRVDLRNDLSWGEGGGFTVNKTLIGSGRCFAPIEVTLTFDDQRRVTEREISGGEFVTAEDHEAARSSAAGTS